MYKNTYCSYTGAGIGAETKNDSASEIYVQSKCLFLMLIIRVTI